MSVRKKLARRLAPRRESWPREVHREPAPPAGWRTAPPDFVGVGVMKAGTSWWFRLLTNHPDVRTGVTSTGATKELHFFDRFCDAAFLDDDVEAYARFFPRPPDRDTVCGEWTPRYMHDYWTAACLERAAPDAKLLVLLRDPVDRYVSGVTHDRARGAPEHPIVAEDQFARGLYGRQMRWLLQSFDRAQILVLQYERCRRDPATELDRTFRFLGLTTPEGSINTELLVNRTRAERFVLHEHVRDALVREYGDDVAWIVREFPEIDVSLWPNFRDG